MVQNLEYQLDKNEVIESDTIYLGTIKGISSEKIIEGYKVLNGKKFVGLLSLDKMYLWYVNEKSLKIKNK